MAVYRSLHLGFGGGIISPAQLAEQAENTATVIIGLGGTGVDCLRRIKTEVYHRLRPDDPAAAEKTYRHIRFLGVDSERWESVCEEREAAPSRLLPLAEEEFLSISSYVPELLQNPDIGNRPELNWLRNEELSFPPIARPIYYSGGVRQVGRLLLMDHAQAFKTRLEQIIPSALEGFGAAPAELNVHIITGSGGSTGSGSFFDVCYLTRSVCAGIPSASILGYVFLPDVNLSKASDQLVRSYIVKNGYAMLKELDYCMQLPRNGGGFEQEYKGGVILPWREPPVDLCHLVGATDEAGNVYQDAYSTALGVVSEYILGFLTAPPRFTAAQRIDSHHWNVVRADGNKDTGACLNYCALGAASACLPRREINTYLAAELFAKFSRIEQNRPTREDVELLALRAMAPRQQEIGAIYSALWQELYNGAFDGYSTFDEDWRNVIGNDEAMVNFYIAQSAAKMNQVETGAAAMTDPENENSLFGRLRRALEDAIGDVSRGPIFAFCMLEAGRTHNLLNIIDGLIEENKVRWNNEAFQDRIDEYQEAGDRFHNRRRKSLFETDRVRFEEYRYRVEVLEQHKFWLEVFDRMDKVLHTFREQVVEAADTYYLQLAYVIKTLLETFAENRQLLLGGALPQRESPISEPLMTIPELRPVLDAEAEKIRVPNAFQAFMGAFLDPDNEETWLAEDEREIAKLVSGFFARYAFSGFDNRSLTSFLKDKYQTRTDAELADRLDADWIVRLTEKAGARFPFDPAVWSGDKSGNTAILSCPDCEYTIQNAAAQFAARTGRWHPVWSAAPDRITAITVCDALPICADRNLRAYEREYFSSPSFGRHLYEGKPIEGMALDDWRRLPSLVPQSLIDLEHAPYQCRMQVEEARALLDRALDAGVLLQCGDLLAPDDSAVQALRRQAEAAAELASQVHEPGQKDAAEAARDALREAFRALPMHPTGDGLPTCGDPSARARVLADQFASAPLFRRKTERILEALEALGRELREADDALEAAIRRVGHPALPAFLNALFTGVIRLAGRKVTYLPEDAFDEDDAEVLSDYSDRFKFKDIPVYQAFVSFQALSDDVKKEIGKRTNELLNDDDPSIAEVTKALADSLSDKKIGVWAKMAKELPGSGDITDFLKKLKERFEVHKMQYLDE